MPYQSGEGESHFIDQQQPQPPPRQQQQRQQQHHHHHHNQQQQPLDEQARRAASGQWQQQQQQQQYLQQQQPQQQHHLHQENRQEYRQQHNQQQQQYHQQPSHRKHEHHQHQPMQAHTHSAAVGHQYWGSHEGSYYPTPSSTQQYHQQRQLQYTSPPSQLPAATLPNDSCHSPDPLQRWQPPPQPRRPPPMHTRQQPQPPTHQQPTASSYPCESVVYAHNQSSAYEMPPQQQLAVHQQPRPHIATFPRNHRPQQPPSNEARNITAACNSIPPNQHGLNPPDNVVSSPAAAYEPQFAAYHHANHASSTTNPSTLQRPQLSPASNPRSSIHPEEQAQERSPKRRRSNDSSVVVGHVSQVLMPVIKRDQGPIRTRFPTPPPPTKLPPSHKPLTSVPGTSIDYQAALLSLSDEYINAAYSMTGFLRGVNVAEEVLDEYQNLLASGLGCLDSVLKNHRISDPRQEARIRLRYASILYEETENLTDAEECLSKGISLCERAKLIDLKYAMHHLTARIWFKSCKFKTAMKTVERLAPDAEKLQLHHWVYAFHFLRVSFGLQIPDNHHETVSLVRYLTAISTVATRHDHVSVQILAHALEALVHLRSRTPDSVDLAIRAMAAARMHQLTPEMTAMPQVKALLDYLDVACSLIRFNRKQADAKVQKMQTRLDHDTRDEAWATSDGCLLRLNLGHNRDGKLEMDSGGIFQTNATGDISLTFSWLTKQQAYAVAYLISGVAKLDGNSGSEAVKYLSHVNTMSRNEPKNLPLSQSAATTTWQTQLTLRATARLYIAFAFCSVSDWSLAANALQSYHDKDLPLLESEPNSSIKMLAVYLVAVTKHGSGLVDEALNLYRSLALQVRLGGSSKGDTAPVSPIKVLAALNSIEILHLRGKHKEAELLLEWTEPYCLVSKNHDGGEHGSRAMESLFYMLKAVASQRAGGLIIDTKSVLQRSVKAAQEVGNSQLLMCVMNIMTDAWFKNIVGQQAVNSGKSARALAQRVNNKLWKAVGTRMYADTLELHGDLAQAQEMRRDAQLLMGTIPPALLAIFRDGRE